MTPEASHQGDPRVSVVIPVYNRATTIERAIRSVLSQSYENIELLVVDDGSIDDPASIVARFRSPAIRMLWTNGRTGAAAARNLGIRHASGTLIAFLDSDDLWDERKVERQVACFRDGPGNLGAVYTGIRTHHPDGSITQTLPEYRGELFKVLQWRNKVGGASTVMVKRAALDKVGLFDTTLPACEDWDLWARIAREYPFDFVAVPCVDYYADRADRLSGRSRAVFIANHRIFRRLNGHRPTARNLSMHLALQSRELYWIGKRPLAAKLAMRSLWLWPAHRERIAIHTLKWLWRSSAQRSLAL
jgi:glycosyltransferase involved in cell wall biosynthesis